MNKTITMTLLVMTISATAAFGQTGNPSSDDYNKNEFFVGHSSQRFEGGNFDLSGIDFGPHSSDFDISDVNLSYKGFNGFDASYTRNITRYLGIQSSFSGAFNSAQTTNRFPVTMPPLNPGIEIELALDGDTEVYNFLGGFQVKDNASESRVKPFAHALIGVGYIRSNLNFDVTCTEINCPRNTFDLTVSDTGFAGAFGGGLDIRLNDKFDIRAIKVDYNPILGNDFRQHNVRFGIGLIIK